MSAALILHRPATAPAQLLLLFHGVGASAESLRSLGQFLALHQPGACIVSVQAPYASDVGAGWQWFSVQGITEANRPARVAAAMARFVQTVQHWQQQTGIGAADTTLLGFSQGAIMALEATQQLQPPAARTVAIAGRFAQPPRTAPAAVRIHLLHGEADPVIAVEQAIEAQARWQALGGEATLDRIPWLGHGIDGRLATRLAERLNG